MHLDLDAVFRSLDPWGRWQFLQLSIIQIQHLAASFNLLSIVFLGYEPPFSCQFGNSTDDDPWTKNISEPFVQHSVCKVRDTRTNVTSPCSHGYVFDAAREDATIVTQWDLVCDKEYQMQLTQTIFIAGQALGATAMTSVADRFGRKWVCILSQLAVGVLAVGTAFSPNILVFSILRFPMGAFQQGIIMTGNVIPIELIPQDKRAMVHLFGSVTWTVSLTAIGALGYAFRDHSWRHLQLGYSSVSIVVILHLLFLDESLRWLYANGKYKQAAVILKKAIRWNGAKIDSVLQNCLEMAEKRPEEQVPLSDKLDVPLDLAVRNPGVLTDTAITPTSGEPIVKKYTILDIFRSRRLLLTALILAFSWIVNSLVYFGLTLASSKLAGDRFVNFMLIAAVELPAGVISYLIMQWVGRKVTIILFDGIAGVALIVAVALKTLYGNTIIITVLTIAGKFGASAAFGALFTYTPELYPTNLRSFGLGLSSAASRIGGMIAPFSVILIKYVPWAPGTIFGVLSLVVCGLIFLLPETRDKELPITVEQIEAWSRKPKRLKQKQLAGRKT